MSARTKAAHIWEREEHEHYVEPQWCSQRLFEVEQFDGAIIDPCCGFGRIPEAAKNAGYIIGASDIVDRGYKSPAFHTCDFLTDQRRPFASNIVCNPPFDIFEKFARHALEVTTGKVAMIWLVPRLNAARWLSGTPLRRIWLLTPRPSMPPGHVISAGQKPGGGTQDFAWLVWERGYQGKPELGWLHRDGAPA